MEPLILERTLIEGLRARDPLAQADLFVRFYRVLRRRALIVVRDPHLAEEIAQESLIKALTGIDSFNGDSTLGTWLTSIVLNEANQRRRREARSRPFSALRRREGRSAAENGADAFDPSWEDVVSHPSHETPETLFLAKEAAHRVERALGSLSRTQRSVVLLRGFQGASPAEACLALTITDIAQRVHLCRARAALRRALEDGGRHRTSVG